MWKRRGFTLVEVVIGALLIVAGGGALLFGMYYTGLHATYLRDEQAAINVAEGRLQQLTAASFATLVSAPADQTCLFEDTNCNGILDAGEDINGNIQLDSEPLTNGRVAIQIHPVAGQPTMLDLRAAVCWTFRGRQIGEGAAGAPCTNQDGNWWVDSPAVVTTRVAQ